MTTIDKKFISKEKQKTFGNNEDISITEFKNLKQKRELQQKVLANFGNQLFRSIIKPRELDNNIRFNKLERLYNRNNKPEDITKRAEQFRNKTLDTISTFPSTITFVYTILLSKEEDKVYDPFSGHNSRAEDILFLNRKYYAYDIHTYPIEFTLNSINRFPKENYELTLGSSEKVKYDNNTFDFSITSPPYSDVEKYNNIYEEEMENDLSSKDYENFLILYSNCIKETFRVLKPSAYFVCVIGNLFKNGNLVNLLSDTIDIGLKIGFKLHDINIYNRGSNIGGDLNYRQYIINSKRLPTIHEYIIIFQKPDYNNIEYEKTEYIEKSIFTEEEIFTIIKRTGGLLKRNEAISLLKKIEKK